MSAARTRAKTATAVGLLTMLFGAFLVIAPSAGADEGDGQNGALAQECRTALGLEDGAFVYAGKWEGGQISTTFVSPSETIGGFDATLRVNVQSIDDGTELFIEFERAAPGVEALVVKQAQSTTTVATFDDVAAGDATYPGDDITDDVSHITLCGAPTDEVEESATLTVVKEVTGEVPEDGWSFGFSVTGEETVTLTDGDDTEVLTVDPGTFAITELDDGDGDGDADFVSYECTNDLDAEADPVYNSDDADDLVADVTLANGDAVTCTFVNDFPTTEQPPFSPPGPPPSTPPAAPPVVLPDVEVPPVVQPEIEAPPVVQPEIEAPPVVQPEIEVPVVQPVAETPTVVESEQVEKAKETPEVKGVTVTRTLPRTGNESSHLAIAGFGLLLLGAALTFGSRRKLRFQS